MFIYFTTLGAIACRRYIDCLFYKYLLISHMCQAKIMHKWYIDI